MARISGVNIPTNKRVLVALTYIYGIGPKISREILGGIGITIDYSPIRHMANIESVYTYEGTHEMHTLIIGEHETGIPAYDS